MATGQRPEYGDILERGCYRDRNVRSAVPSFCHRQANVYRIPSNGGTPQIYAGGFTKIIDLAFGPNGSLYVLQISSTGGAPPQGGTGSLIRLSPDATSRTTIVGPGEGLVAPGGVAIAGDGSIYVTNLSVSPGTGTVVKIVP